MLLSKAVALVAGVFVGVFFRWKGGDYMRAVYVALIVNGRMTIDNVAKSLREVVLADLAALGLDGYGKPLEDVTDVA